MFGTSSGITLNGIIHLIMTRIPYTSKDISEPKELVAAIRARRGGTLLNLDRMLLHSPPLAQGWNGFLRAVRNELTVDPKLRELAICVVAVLNHAHYEFHHHAPLWLAAGGTSAQVEALRRWDASSTNMALFDTAEAAVIRLATEMTRNVAVADAVFAAVHAALPNDQQVVELVAVIAVYNMVSRVLVALQVEPE
jgi:alkylhydroperoxidase family enzyme